MEVSNNLKTIERKPTWESTPYNFDSTHDLTKASTTKKCHKGALGVPFSTLM